MEKVTAQDILETLRVMSESEKFISREEWLKTACQLEGFAWAENKELNRMRQELAKQKVELLRKQEKKNVSEIEIMIQSTDAYREMRDQESKVEAMEQFVMLAKKSSDSF